MECIMKSVSIVELHDKLNEVNIIDVREDYEFASGRIPGARSVPLRELAFNHEKYLNKNDEYFVVCQSGSRSVQLIDYLAKENYNFTNVTGGTGVYALQYPLEK